MTSQERLAYMRKWQAEKLRERRAEADVQRSIFAAWLKFSTVCAASRRALGNP
jgi:hypothetical protein